MKNVKQGSTGIQERHKFLRVMVYKTHLIVVQFHTMFYINMISAACNIFNREWNLGTSISHSSSTYTMYHFISLHFPSCLPSRHVYTFYQHHTVVLIQDLVPRILHSRLYILLNLGSVSLASIECQSQRHLACGGSFKVHFYTRKQIFTSHRICQL